MKTSTILKTLFGLAGAGLAGYFIVREYKKNVKTIEVQEETERKELEKIGINKDQFEKEIVPGLDDDNLTKALLFCVKSNTDIDDDAIDIQSCIDNENVIHLRQTDARGFKSFDYLFEIPEDATQDSGNFKRPKINHYLREFKEVREEVEKTFGLRVHVGLEGYFIFRYKNVEGKLIQATARIPEEYYRPYADNEHDGLVDYISAIRENYNLINLSSLYQQGCTEVEILDVRLLYKYSFDRRSLDLKKSYEILKYLKNIVCVTRDRASREDKLYMDRGQAGVVSYDYVMFNTVGPAGNWNLLYYYEKLPKEGIITNCFDY